MSKAAARSADAPAPDATSATPGAPEPTAFRQAGEVVGSYRIKRLLARGGLSEVYLAENQVTGTAVVIKVLAPRFQNRADLQQRLKVEAHSGEILAHPNIVRMRDAGLTADGRVYIAMDYVPGRTLREQLELSPDRRLDLVGTLQIMIQIVSGIRFAHLGGVLHRDLKPENVMVLPDGRAKIVDFGIAKITHRGDDSAEMPKMGTLRYLSPEQIRNEPVDERADIYALGIILYEMFGGKHPFDLPGETASDAEMIARHLSAQPMPLSELLPGEDDEAVLAVWRVVQRCVAKEPKDRISIDQLLEELCEIARTSVAPVHPEEVRVSRVIKLARERRAEVTNATKATQGTQSDRDDPTPTFASEQEPQPSRAALMPEPPPPAQDPPADGDGQRRTEPAVFDPGRPVLPFVAQPRPQLGVGHTMKLARPDPAALAAARAPAAPEPRRAFAPAQVELTPTPNDRRPAQPVASAAALAPRAASPTSAARATNEGSPKAMNQAAQSSSRSDAPTVFLAVACGAIVTALGALALRVGATVEPRPAITVVVEPSASAPGVSPPAQTATGSATSDPTAEVRDEEQPSVAPAASAMVAASTSATAPAPPQRPRAAKPAGAPPPRAPSTASASAAPRQAPPQPKRHVFEVIE